MFIVFVKKVIFGLRRIYTRFFKRNFKLCSS